MLEKDDKKVEKVVGKGWVKGGLECKMDFEEF